MLLRPLLISTLLAASTLPAFAMTPSCGIVEPLRLYQEAQASADRFVVLLGQLGLEENLNEMDTEHPPFAAPFTGHQLTPEGFTAPISATIDVTHDCDEDFFGICGWLRQGEETLLFARQAEDGRLSVTVGACGRWAQQRVDPEDLEILKQCAASGCPTEP